MEKRKLGKSGLEVSKFSLDTGGMDQFQILI